MASGTVLTASLPLTAAGYELDGANSEISKDDVGVVKDQETTVTLINAYKTKEVNTGSLVLKKTVTGPAGCTTTTKFTFYVKGEDGKWYGADGKPSADSTASSGYELDTANSDTSKDDVEVVKDTATTVTLVNAYKTKEVDKGSLILKKKVTGESGGANTTSFTFYVKGEDGKWYDKDGNPSDTQVGITVDSSNADGVEVKNLPVQKYDITEKTSGTASILQRQLPLQTLIRRRKSTRVRSYSARSSPTLTDARQHRSHSI